MEHFLTSLADQARAQQRAATDTPVVFMIGNGVGFYSTWAGSPPSGVLALVRAVNRLAKDPSRHIQGFVVPEYWTSQRCAYSINPPRLLTVCLCRCIDCAHKLVEVHIPSTVKYREAPVAGPGFVGPVVVPPLGTSTNIASKFLAEVEKETPTWEKEIEAAQEKQKKVKSYRQSRKSDQGRMKQRKVHPQRRPLQ